MNVGSQQERVRSVQAQCEMHWLVNRIPQDRSEEMADELGQHLEEAARDGKTVEDVFGPDVLAFAQSWSEEDRPVWTAKDRVVEYVWTLSFQAAFFAIVFHLIKLTLFVPVLWLVIPYLLIISWPLSRLVVTGRGPQGDSQWWRRWLWPPGAVLLIILVFSMNNEERSVSDVLYVAITKNTDGTLLVWPWYGTVAAIVTHVVASKFRK